MAAPRARLSREPNSLGFQEQSGGHNLLIELADIRPNSLGFQEQSGGLLRMGTPLTKSAEQLGISGTVRRDVVVNPRKLSRSRTAWDFRNSQAESFAEALLGLVRRTAWDFRNSQAVGLSTSSPKSSAAEQLGISGTVRRTLQEAAELCEKSRTAWDFRNSQAAMLFSLLL